MYPEYMHCSMGKFRTPATTNQAALQGIDKAGSVVITSNNTQKVPVTV